MTLGLAAKSNSSSVLGAGNRADGNKRRSKSGVWFTTCDDEKQAKRLGQQWAFKGKLSRAVLH